MEKGVRVFIVWLGLSMYTMNTIEQPWSATRNYSCL